MRTPVALMIFNRPAPTARVLEAIARAQPPLLLVVGDGPRPAHPEDRRLCEQTRAVIERVDWRCEVRTDYSGLNLGCKRRIVSGLNWVFDQVEEAIVLEDDTLPEPSFFGYCEELLERYRGDRRVQMISGTNVLPPARGDRHSYRFSRCYHVWGWASWARAWRQYDLEMRRWPALRDSGWLERLLGDEREAALVRQFFDRAHAGEVPTWDIQWVFSSWSSGGLSVLPAVNLVTNIGFGAGAAHEQNPRHRLANLPARPIELPLRHPPSIAVDEEADHQVWRQVYPAWFDGGCRRARLRPRRRWRGLRPSLAPARGLRPGASPGQAGERAEDVVLTSAALGYTREQVLPFLRSLRRAGASARVVLFADAPLARALEREPPIERLTVIRVAPYLPMRLGLLSHRRLMGRVWFPIAEAILAALRRLPTSRRMRLAALLRVAPALYTPMEARFLRYWRYLRRHPHRRVLLSDVRDVLFQGDPMAACPEEALGVTIETDRYCLAGERHNAAWIKRVYGEQMLAAIGPQRVANVGVTLGAHADVERYLERMAAELLALSPARAGIGGGDMAVHNALIWTGRAGQVELLAPLEGPAATLNGIGEGELRLDAEGRLLNRDGSHPSIVHQYDRQPTISARLLRALAGG
jgi:hypothetical protein